MKSLVAYSSQTNNTKKLAEAVLAVLPEPREITAVAEAPSPDGYDFVAVGFWLKAGKAEPGAREYLERLQNADCKVFLFATHGAADDSEHARAAMEDAAKIVGAARLAGSFNCQGEVAPAHLEMVNNKPEPPVWAKDAPSAKGRPDAADIGRLQAKVAEAIGA